MERVQSLPFGFTISRLIQLMIAVPVLIVLLFTAKIISDQLAVLRGAQRTQELVTIVLGAKNLISRLQKERGLTAGLVAAGSTNNAAIDAVMAQRGLVDEARAEFDALTAGGVIDPESELGRDLEAVRRALEIVPRQRARTDERVATSEEVVANYTEAIAPLIRFIENAGNASGDYEVARILVAGADLVRKTELAGQERAILYSALSRGGVTPSERRELEWLARGQVQFEELFAQRAGRDLARFYKTTITGSAVENVQRLRTLALDPARSARAAAVDPAEWFDAATRHIDLHSVVDERIAEAILQLSATRRRSALRELSMAALATLVGVGFSLLIPARLSRQVNRALSEMSSAALESANQIASAVEQMGSGVTETSSAVTETTSTIEEIRQTSIMAASKAEAVAESTDRVGTTMREALDAVDRGIEAMHRIRSEVEGIAQSILSLSERNIQIGEIIETVNGIAEQSNLLAVNASIEAAKAGEYGKGFSVVASEVKALASQSKEATAQIRAILAEIQKASNSAVMVTEQGVKRVEEGGMLVDELGQTIRRLGEVIDESRDAAQQILLSSNQQAAGVEQATEAMRNIDQAMADSVATSTQLAQAAAEVRAVSDRLFVLIAGQKVGTARNGVQRVA